MLISKERLQQVALQSGYRAEIIEKVVNLIQALQLVAKDPYLKERLVLKGGTALNLFHFDLPRLSVDIDLNYMGAVERETMLSERPIVEARLQAIMQQLGMQSYRSPSVHAGGKMIWRYPSSLGGQGNLEVDLNFMYRLPLWPVVFKDSCLLANLQAKDVPVLDIHELAAGKLSALIDRGAGRDIFDAHHLLTQYPLDKKRLRTAWVVYAGMSRKPELHKLNPQTITFDLTDLKNKLLPVLKRDVVATTGSVKDWAQRLLQESRQAFESLLPFTKEEVAFITGIRERGEIMPELFCQEEELIGRIKQHPGLLWAARQHRQ